MLEWFFSLLLSYPSAFNVVGRALLALSALFAVLGLRLDRIGGKVERMSARVGIVPPDIMATLPWWLRMVIPDSPLSWLLLAACALFGIWLAKMGKWANKL